MSRKRSLSTDISVDPKLAALAEYGVLPLLLYTWAIPHADDYGRITADAVQFRLMVCPALDVTRRDVDDALDQIAAVGLWERGEKVIQFPADSWFKHQSYISGAKRPGAAQKQDTPEEQRETPQNAEEQREPAQNPSSPSPSPSLTLSLSEREKEPPPSGESRAPVRAKRPCPVKWSASGPMHPAVLIFHEKRREKMGRSPTRKQDEETQLAAFYEASGETAYRVAVDNYLSDLDGTDDWPRQKGYTVIVFIRQFDQWRDWVPVPPKGVMNGNRSGRNGNGAAPEGLAPSKWQPKAHLFPT